MKIHDMIGRTISLHKPVERIVSLIPSITETLFELGLGEKIVGITTYCIHPEGKLDNIHRIGGTKNPNIRKIASLSPDIIIADKNENRKEKVEELMKIAPVYVIEVNNFDDALKMISRLAEIFDKAKEANGLIEEINDGFAELHISRRGKKVFFPIWKNPCMSINRDTFIHSMIEKLGYTNLCAGYGEHYPVITGEQMEKMNPDYVFLPSEPCSYKPEDVEDCKRIFPAAKVLPVDGQMFAWYGARMKYAARYFVELIP